MGGLSESGPFPMFIIPHHAPHHSLYIICEITSWGELFSSVLMGGLSRAWTVLKAMLVLFDVASLCWALNIVHPAYCFNAQFNLLSVTLWCHRTTWTLLWGLWRWTCHQVCDEFIVLAGVNISSACGILSTGSVQLG